MLNGAAVAVEPLCIRCSLRPYASKTCRLCSSCATGFYSYRANARRAGESIPTPEAWTLAHPYRTRRRKRNIPGTEAANSSLVPFRALAPAPSSPVREVIANGICVEEEPAADGERAIVDCDGALGKVADPPPQFPAFSELVPGFVIASPEMRALARTVKRVAALDSTVLITGETGSGKELVASAIHQLSRRSSRPFIVIDCTTLSEDLIESELFGHVRGTFTGAERDRAGLFEAAHTGTVFLDEVSELPFSFQAKLLRVLESRQLRRIGSNAYSKVDIRIVAATNRDLSTLVAEGKFRSDLYHRLNVFPIDVPPLRDRPDDIRALAQHFLESLHGSRKVFAPTVFQYLEQLMWDGNVRELKNTVERAAILADGDTILPQHILASSPVLIRSGAETFPLPYPMEEIERRQILALVAACDGNKSLVSERTGLGLRTIYNRLARYGKLPSG